MHYCPYCGYEYEEDVVECPDCHVDLITEELTHCSECGELTQDHQVFCDHCGSFVSEARKVQFTLRTKEHDVVGSCVICGNWIHEGTGDRDGHRWFCDSDDHYQVYEDWVVVMTSSMEIETRMLATQLESAGIPVQVLNQKDSSYVVNAGDLSVIKLMVPKDRVKDAEEILGQIRNESDTE